MCYSSRFMCLLFNVKICSNLRYVMLTVEVQKKLSQMQGKVYI